MTNQEAQDAFMEWAMRDYYKNPLPLEIAWWGAFVAIWNMISKSYTVDVLWSSATGEPMPNGDTYPADAAYRQACRDYLTELGIALP